MKSENMTDRPRTEAGLRGEASDDAGEHHSHHLVG